MTGGRQNRRCYAQPIRHHTPGPKAWRESPRMLSLRPGTEVQARFQEKGMKAVSPQPAGQSQRREFLLGRQNPFSRRCLKTAGKGILRRGDRSRGDWQGQFFWHLDNRFPPFRDCGWHGSWHRRIYQSHSDRRTGNRLPGPVRPESRRSQRTYRSIGSVPITSFPREGPPVVGRSCWFTASGESPALFVGFWFLLLLLLP